MYSAVILQVAILEKRCLMPKEFCMRESYTVASNSDVFYRLSCSNPTHKGEINKTRVNHIPYFQFG